MQVSPWFFLEYHFDYENQNAAEGGDFEEAGSKPGGCNAEDEGGGSGLRDTGGLGDGREGHYRKGHIGHVVKERADEFIFYLRPYESQGKDSDGKGHSGHDEYVDIHIVFHLFRLLFIFLYREKDGGDTSYNHGEDNYSDAGRKLSQGWEL